MEHLLFEEECAAAATEFILALLQAARGASVVVTSRLPLQILAESVIRLEGLSVPMEEVRSANKRDMANSESVRLFVYHARRALPSFVLSEEKLPAIAELCRSLGGMPLAIELAATLIPHFAPDELGRAIRQNMALLVSSRRSYNHRGSCSPHVNNRCWRSVPSLWGALAGQPCKP
jgi:predicted ATPase